MPTAEERTFYDQHPFDWAASGTPNIRAVVSPLLVDLIESLTPESFILDVGCGPGRVLRFLSERGLRCAGLDRSRVSVQMAADRCHCPGAVADNLQLPIATEAVDVVISDGVIHHTENPRESLRENLRILRIGGKLYLGVYKPSGRYPLLYQFPGAWFRFGLLHSWSKPFVVVFGQVPYFLVHYARSKGRRTWAGALNLFYDYFVTPRVAFLSQSEIEKWAVGEGATILRYDENRGANVHSFLLQKTAPSPPPGAGSDVAGSFAAK